MNIFYDFFSFIFLFMRTLCTTLRTQAEEHEKAHGQKQKIIYICLARKCELLCLIECMSKLFIAFQYFVLLIWFSWPFMTEIETKKSTNFLSYEISESLSSLIQIAYDFKQKCLVITLLLNKISPRKWMFWRIECQHSISLSFSFDYWTHINATQRLISIIFLTGGRLVISLTTANRILEENADGLKFDRNWLLVCDQYHIE